MVEKMKPRKCPSCSNLIESVYETDFPGPFLARDGMEGLTVWAAYSAQKEVICQGEKYLHIHFPGTGEERLVFFEPDDSKFRPSIFLCEPCPEYDDGCNYGYEDVRNCHLFNRGKFDQELYDIYSGKIERGCQVEGCQEDGRPCFLRESSGEFGKTGIDVYYYCWDHAHEQGFCPGCGQFYGGFEEFEFSETKLCPECEENLRVELGEYDDDQDWEIPFGG